MCQLWFQWSCTGEHSVHITSFTELSTWPVNRQNWTDTATVCRDRACPGVVIGEQTRECVKDKELCQRVQRGLSHPDPFPIG